MEKLIPKQVFTLDYWILKKRLIFVSILQFRKEVDFFLFAGDAYKTANPSPTQQKLLMRCFFRLYQAKIPIVIIVGNHDNPLSFGKANSLDVFGQYSSRWFSCNRKTNNNCTTIQKMAPFKLLESPGHHEIISRYKTNI